MEDVVFHGTIDTNGNQAHQEFYIRHADGSPISSEAERQRVTQCLQALGLQSDVTRTFRENGLLVAQAEVLTKGNMASDVFYLTGAVGQAVDHKVIDAVRQRIGVDCLVVREEQLLPLYRKAAGDRGNANGGGGIGLFNLGNLVKRNLFNLGVIKSCS